uniref:Endonuclease/exonuclease/phosphatase domain-containing protein n=1 Tax=Amphiprion ocellaris TaxID=80972 RepID=A0AAQ6AH14_AMPOC
MFRLMDEQKKKQVAENQYSIRTLAEILVLTATENTAQRGHRESLNSKKKGFFLSMLDLLGNHNPIIKKRLQQQAKKEKYTSKTIQNELLEQTKTPACRYAARWQPHQPTILRRANNPPRRNPLVTKLIRKRSQTAQHGNGPQPAPDQRVRINLRHRTRVATWNVQTLHRPGYATLLSRELCRYNITLAGLCEVRWQGNGEITAGDHCYIWSGPERRTGLYGVALAIPMALRKSLISWTPMSDRLLSARFLHQHGKLTVIVAYAPTDVADEDVKDAFWDQLHQAVGQAPPHDITIILTDANATLSSSDRSTGSPVGTTFADRTTNDNGNRLLLLCHHNNLCVADTWFPRKRIHHWTWYSLDGRTRKALDHILISRRWKSSVTNCRVYRGAELGNTDHRRCYQARRLDVIAGRWLDVIAGVLKQHGVAVEDAELLAQDRQQWKKLVHLVGSTHMDGMPRPPQEP